MNNTTIATTAAVKKQFNIGSTETLKNRIAEMAVDFTRPAAVAKAPPVKASEKEMLEILFNVATDRRFKVEIVTDDNGEEVYDDNGLLETNMVDLFEKEWEAIKLRDYSEQVSKTPTIAGLEASIRKYGKALNLTEETISAMIASAKAGQSAPVEA